MKWRVQMSKSKKNPETALLEKYNELLKQYWAIEDGSLSVMKTPTYRRINEGLKETAREIAKTLGGVEGTLQDVINYFKDGELTHGFQI
jgi:hypothetical protein